jgi:carboxymethylenebutenolidase
VNDIEVMQGLREFPLARRGLMMSSLMTGLTLATTRVEAQAIHTDAAGIDAGEVKIPEADTDLPGYFARPVGDGPFPIVLVNEEVFGIHEYIKDVCRRFAKLGYLAVAVEIYARIGDLSKVTDQAEIGAIVGKAPDATVMTDLDGALKWAVANKGDASRIGTTGFCAGGRITWLYAVHNPNLKAAASWYGPVMGTQTDLKPNRVIDIADQILCPVLGLYGGRDGFAKVTEAAAAAAKARAASKIVEIVDYPDAPHGFHADYRPSYRAADAADGWQRMLQWFTAYGMSIGVQL